MEKLLRIRFLRLLGIGALATFGSLWAKLSGAVPIWIDVAVLSAIVIAAVVVGWPFVADGASWLSRHAPEWFVRDPGKHVYAYCAGARLIKRGPDRFIDFWLQVFNGLNSEITLIGGRCGYIKYPLGGNKYKDLPGPRIQETNIPACKIKRVGVLQQLDSDVADALFADIEESEISTSEILDGEHKFDWQHFHPSFRLGRREYRLELRSGVILRKGIEVGEMISSTDTGVWSGH